MDFKKLMKDKKYAREKYNQLNRNFYENTQELEEKIFGKNSLTKDLTEITSNDILRDVSSGCNRIVNDLSIPLTLVGMGAGVYGMSQIVNGNLDKISMYNLTVGTEMFFGGLSCLIYSLTKNKGKLLED